MSLTESLIDQIFKGELRSLGLTPFEYLQEKYKTRYITVGELATELKVNPRTIHAAIRKNKCPIPVLHHPGWPRTEDFFAISEVAHYMDRLEEAATKAYMEGYFEGESIPFRFEATRPPDPRRIKIPEEI